MKRPRRSRDFRRSCIEISHRGCVKRTYRELLSRDLSQRSCQEVQRYQEILFRDVVLRSFIEVSPTDLVMDLVQVLLTGALT